MNVNNTSPLRGPEVNAAGREGPTSRSRYGLGRPRVLLLIAAVLAVGGVVFNWSWLVAVGAAPVLLALLPCAAMCAIGICMRPKGDAACSSSNGETAENSDRKFRDQP